MHGVIFQKKSWSKKVLLGLLRFKSYGINMKYAQGDNAGENEDFEKACKKEGMGIQFEYAVQGAPPTKWLCWMEICYLI